MIKKMKLTAEEKAIENAVARGEYRPVSRDKFEMIARAIERRRKDAVLNLRINRADLDSIKRKAKLFGVPYQAFLAELIHRFAL